LLNLIFIGSGGSGGGSGVGPS